METIWKLLSGLVVLLVLQLCNGLPLDLERTYADAQTQFLTGLVAILLTICSIVCLAGCLCCQRGNGFKDKKEQEFHDSPVGVSVASDLDRGHVNPIAHSEFTIFTPLAPPHQNNNVFLANQQIIKRVDEDYKSGDLDVSDWFNSGEIEFPRTQLKYIRELGKGWFGRVVEGTATGLLSTTQPTLHTTSTHINGTTFTTNITPTITTDHPLNPTANGSAHNTVTSTAPRWAPVVVRILDAGAGANQRLHFLHDATIYRVNQHANILRLEGRCLDTVPLLLLQEYCAKGDLKHYLLSQKTDSDQFLSSELPLRWCWQLASALKHLHSYKLTHPDLATRNCQLDDNLQLKLGDYGTTVAKYPEDYYHGSEVVPVRWRAPETIIFTPTTIQQKKVNTEGNIWSFGVCMWEIFECGSLPYSWLNNDEVVSRVLGPSNVRLSKPKCKILYTDYIYRLMQLCWSTVESRPAITQIELMLLDLLQVYQHTQETNSERSSNAPVSLQDFDNRWDTFKPNTIVKTDNQIDGEIPTIALNFNKASPSLKNLAGSLDNLLEAEGRQLDSWLENVASSTGDLSYVRGLSEAINDLDNAIALENVSSSESSSRPNSGNVKQTRNKLQFKLGPIQSKSNYLSSDNKNSLISSESETEDENWKRKIERGAYTEKVRQKSRSVADLMILTHIDTSESDSETTPSLDTKTTNRNSLLFGSEGNLLNVESRFQEELRKLQFERRDSLLFVPERKSSLRETNADAQEKITPVYNVYNVVTITPVKIPKTNLEEIINYERDLDLNTTPNKKADSPDIVTSKYLQESTVDVPDIISSCNGTVDVGSSNASTEALDKLDALITQDEKISDISSCALIFELIVRSDFNSDKSDVLSSSVCRIVPKLTEIIESNAALMDYIIEKYDSDNVQANKTICEEIKFGCIDDSCCCQIDTISEAVNLNVHNNYDNSNNNLQLTNNFENLQASNDIKTYCEQFIDNIISNAINIHTNKQHALIRTTQDFINTEIVQYEDSNKIINFNQEESSVILGACDDYSIDLYASLKTAVAFNNGDVIPAPLQQIYSSARSEDAAKMNFSLDTWDQFLGSSFERTDDFEDTGMFSQPQSLLFIENGSSKLGSDCDVVAVLNDPQSFLEQLTDLDDVKLAQQSDSGDAMDIWNRTYNIESSVSDVLSEGSDCRLEGGLDVSDINVELEDAEPGLNETFVFNEDESIWQNSSKGGWFLHPQVDGIPTGNILNPHAVADNKEYVGFDLDDNIMAAIRNELMAKLPHAQRASNEHTQDSDDSELSTSSDKNELIMSYNYYNKQLSPIPEESYSEMLNSGQSTPNCTINSTSSSSDPEDDTNRTNGNNTWSDSADHSVSGAVKLSSHNVSDSEDDSPQLPVDIVDVSMQRKALLSESRQLHSLEKLDVGVVRNDDSISEGCLTRSELEKKPDLLTGHAPRSEQEEDQRLVEDAVEERLACSTTIQSPTSLTLTLTTTATSNSASFLNHERNLYDNIDQQQHNQLPRFTFNNSLPPSSTNTLNTNTQCEESSTSSDTTYVTASDGSVSVGSGGHLLLNFGTKGGPGSLVPPLNSPEDRLPWRPPETLAAGGRLLHVDQMDKHNLDSLGNDEDEYGLLPSSDDMIEVSSAYLDETSGSAGIPSSDEKQLSQDSDTMPIDELQSLLQQEKERKDQDEFMEEGNIRGNGERGGNNDANEYENVPSKLEDADYCTISEIKSFDKIQKVIEHDYDDVMFHDHHYINEEKVTSDHNTNTSKLEYDYASYMNHLNTKQNASDSTRHLNNTNNTSPVEYDDVPTENINTIEEYTNISPQIEQLSSLGPDYVNITPQSDSATGESVRDYVNVPMCNKVADTLRDYVNAATDNEKIERTGFAVRMVDCEEVTSPPSEIDLDAAALVDSPDVYTPLEDIRFEGPAADLHLMSTSFSDSNDLGDEHDEDWDSGSDTGSSSSGLFIWKEGEHEACVKALHAAPDTHAEQISPLDEIREEPEDTSSGSDVDDDDDDDDADGIEFVPSAWDKYALPIKSALRSPEKTIELKPKGVWFKKQKYHCIYEYPREPESPLAQQTFDLWQPAPEYPMCPADWDSDSVDLSTTSSYSDGTRRMSRAHDHVPEYSIDEDFYIRSAIKPFELASLYDKTAPGQSSQFFPGGRSVVDGTVDYWLRPISNVCNSNGVHGAGTSSGYSSEVSTTPTPDSGAEDSGASSGELLSDGSEQGPLPLKTLCQLSATANGLLTHHRCPMNEQTKDGNRKIVTDMEIGGLRHTRNKLKLDLPPSPSAFTSNKAFNVGNVCENEESIVKRNSAITFSTFGKSRFLVQQVATPPDDDNTKSSGNNGRRSRNVSFEALPYKPRLPLIENSYGDCYHCGTNSSQNLSREDVYTTKEHNNTENSVKSSVLGGINGSGKVEVVRGEASLLDSADEDSGIESSTLDRKRKVPSLSSSPSKLSVVVTGTIMEI